MNEIDLIREVEKRPILYDKFVVGFNKTKLRDDAWKEVQDSLNVSESECKKRWRSLRDSFIKLQRTHGGRTRWPYHQAMKFLLPHVEPKGELGSSKKDEDSDAEEELQRQRAIQALPDLSFPEKFDDDDDSAPSPKKARLNSTDEETPCSQCNRTDPDELFLLSCSPILKRLNSKQNARARLKIQQVLYEAEFGAQMGIPYGSECDFDGIEGPVE
ncbi:transcription factor Adf-1 [Amyelois transitella]|uniref:transcription factor Adf-1 n=1 Tax=Amyelois transitella TaxID=680683 RepID=UPI00067D702B|nr:transcription factor Adf-1 [Amyelois transitella]